MSAPGTLRAAGLVAAKDLRIEWRTWETSSSSLVFALAILVIFSFSFGSGTSRGLDATELVPGVIWTVITFSSIVGMIRSLQLEQRRGALAALFSAPIDRSAIYLGKTAANVVKLTLLQWIVLPLVAVLFSVDLGHALAPLLLVLFLHGLGLAELGTLFAAVATRVGRGEALLATLLLPAVSPVIISAVKTTEACVARESLSAVSHWLLLTIGFDVLYLFVALMTFEFVLED